MGGTFAPASCGMIANYSGQPDGGLLDTVALAAMAIRHYMLHRALTLRALASRALASRALASHATMLIRA